MNRLQSSHADFPWNPVSGCQHGCRYCSGAVLARQLCGDIRLNRGDPRCGYWKESKNLHVLHAPFVSRGNRALNFPFGYAPTLHTYRLNYPSTQLISGVNINVCNHGELFGPWVPDDWIDMVLEACGEAPQHNYLLCTSYPERYHERRFAPNMWLGSTVATMDQAQRLPRHKPEQVDGTPANTFLAIEPLLEPVAMALRDVVPSQKWVVIGPETGSHPDKVTPQREWVEEILTLCSDHGVPVWMNKDLLDIWGDRLIQQHPHELYQHRPPASENRRYARCSFCKVMQARTELTTILARKRRGESALTLAQICPHCYDRLLEQIASHKPVEGFCNEYPLDGQGVQTDNR